MDQRTTHDYPTRLRLLDTELRQLRRDADVWGTGATIHRLRNCVAAAYGALILLLESDITQRDPAAAEMLIELVQSSLRDGRTLIAVAQQIAF